MIVFEDVGFRYASEKTPALQNITFGIKRGEFVLLTGRSGCGKTTVTRLLNGLIPRFYDGDLTGDIRFDGKSIKGMKLHEISEYTGSVFQDPRSQFFTTDTSSEIAFACENAALPMDEINRRVCASVKDLRIEHLADRDIFTLSSGEKQAVAIASVYAFGPLVYVLDEPSANLDTEATEKLKQMLRVLKDKGCTVVISEHRLHYLRELVDRAVLMADGAVVRTLDRPAFLQLTNEDAGKLGLRCLFAEEPAADGGLRPAFSKPVMEVEKVSFQYPGCKKVLEDITFSVGGGEVVGVVGHNGAGKSTLLELICGLRREKAGIFRINGKKVTAKQRIKAAYYVMQDCDYQLFTESVEQELLLGHTNEPGLREKAELVMRLLDLDDFRERHPASLSGGQKQRVSIAVAFMKNAEILCFDEPTSGLDLENMRRTAALFRELAQRGKAIVVVSHDREFLSAACSRIVRLQTGCVQEDYIIKVESPTCRSRLSDRYLKGEIIG